MMAELINRKQLKADVKAMLTDAQVSARAMVALYLGIVLVLDLVETFTGDIGLLSTFISILTSLLALILGTGFTLYCMAIRRGERAEFLTLFDGFSFVGKIIALNIIMYFFVFLWSMLFIIPGIIATYRYRFAIYNLCENPGISPMEALDMSKRQTMGYKTQLFMLDMSYLGWTLLVSIPTGVYNLSLSQEMLMDTMAYAGVSTIAAMPVEVSITTALPVWSWVLISGLWRLLVSLFYYSNYQCVELGYFEIAKRTSGVGEGAAPRQDSWTNGPDNMGGF